MGSCYLQRMLQQKGWVKTAVYLIQWWLHYDVNCFSRDSSCQNNQKSIDPSDSLLHLMQSLVDTTLLSSESALPDDLAYFGSTCFQDCMLHFSNHATHLSEQSNPGHVRYSNRRTLQSYGTCLGEHPCFDVALPACPCLLLQLRF